MDYSTISNKTNCTEVEDFSTAELCDKYYSLKKQFENLSSTFESTKQELHDTRRSYQTALDVQKHLTAELESLQSQEERRQNDFQSRITNLQEEVTNLRQERLELTEKHANEIKKLETDLKLLKEEQEVRTACESPEKNVSCSELDEVRAALSTALSNAETIKSELEEAQNECTAWKMKVEDLVGEVGEMRAAAEMRREEMKALVERESTAVAELAEAKAMLHCMDNQDLQPHAAKGNSIFAEVEDKRQEMAQTLVQMKQTNSRLRRDLANKQVELEALLHEKQTIWEQQAGAAAHHDRELIESYEQRISQLESMCERQRRELAKWFGKQTDSVGGWLPGVLDHFKSECEKLRAEVLSYGAAQLASAAQVRDLHRKLAQLTSNAPKAGSPKDSEPNVNDNKDDTLKNISMKFPKRPSVEDVKKKVSFN